MEVLAACCTQFNVVTRVMVDTSLGKHSIVLYLTFPKIKVVRKLAKETLCNTSFAKVHITNMKMTNMKMTQY